MKIEKHTNGNVLILNNDDSIRSILSPTLSVTRDSGTGDKIYVNVNGHATLIDYTKVTHLVVGGVETPFTGDADDLMTELSDDFFYHPAP